MVPWRYVIPRTGYFRSLAVARKCPEIRWHVDRMALLGAGEMLVSVPMLLGYLVLLPLIWMAERCKGALAWVPDFSAKRLETLRQAHEILSVDEIRERIGLEPTPRIMTKAEVAALRKNEIHCTANMAETANIEDD